MFSRKELLIFLAGATAFHTLSHIMLYWSNIFPFEIFGIVVTQQLNMVAIVVNALITVGLLYYASNTRR